jgi:amicoumacin kinase
VPRPGRSIHGNLFEEVIFQDEMYIASAAEKAPGVLAETMTLADWNDGLFQALGSTLGKCHRAAQLYHPRRPNLRRPDWYQSSNCFHPKESLEGADCILLEKRKKVLNAIQMLPKDREGYGLAHLDLHFGNFFVDAARREIYLLDFDDCAYGWFVMDIAMLLFDVLVVYDGAQPVEFGERFLENLLRGYYTQLSLNYFWVSQLTGFLKLLEIGVYLMLYREVDPHMAEGWVGKFMRGRQVRIENEIPYVDMDFEAVYRRSR